MIRGILLVLVATVAVTAAWGASPSVGSAQPDSVRTRILTERGLPADHSPKKALWRGFAVPGWGQVYNRQYYKVPFVYAGLAGLVYLATNSHSNYKLYQRAHRYKISEERVQGGQIDENPYTQFRDQYEQVLRESGLPTDADVPSRTLRSQRDAARQQRDLSIVGTAVFYSLTVLDAYVSAHLLTFDVGDDLSVKVVPSPLQRSASLQVRF